MRGRTTGPRPTPPSAGATGPGLPAGAASCGRLVEGARPHRGRQGRPQARPRRGGGPSGDLERLGNDAGSQGLAQRSVAVSLRSVSPTRPVSDGGSPLEAEVVELVSNVDGRLLRVGLALAGLESRLGPGQARDRLEEAAEELDAAIRELRSLAFRLVAEGKGGEPPRAAT